MKRALLALSCVAALGGAVWLSSARRDTEAKWAEVAPGVYRSPGLPAGYALVSGDRAVLIDAPALPEGLKARGVKSIELVLLTHHHRDSLASVGHYLAARVPVRAPEGSKPWLLPQGVKKHWRDALPLRSSRTGYLVLAEGHAGIDCSLKDGQTIKQGDWVIDVVGAPGHSTDHTAFLVRHKDGGKKFLFCGGALASAGKVWSPYTTDWDHWTDAGLTPAAKTLRKLAKLKPDVLLPAHGDVIGATAKSGRPVRALEQTAAAVEEVAFLKSYERYTRERLGKPPKYEFLAKGQAGSNGSKPWSKLSANLWFTGNTYVLRSKDGPCLVVDPWSPHSEKQIVKLQNDEKLGRVEVALCSHAHYDHYDGAYFLRESDRPLVWALDRVAAPLERPFQLWAPFLDARPLKVNRKARDGETIKWREYSLRFHFLPGQTLYTMGVETTIDGKRSLFTADNFFHHDLYSGTGGWMGLNRSGPRLYEQSARKVLALKPDWVLAEHGSAMEFSAADFERRVRWGQAGTKAADALCVSGDYRHDWTPHAVSVQPVLHRVRGGATVEAELVVENALPRKRKLSVALQGRGLTKDQTWEVEVGPGATARRAVKLALSEKAPAGRQSFTLTAREGDKVEPGDAFVVVDVVK